MRSNWIRLFILWLRYEAAEARLVGQAWIERTTTLAALMLVLEAIGLFFQVFAAVVFTINLILGAVLVYRATFAIVSADFLENFFKTHSKQSGGKKESEDIPTMKIVGSVIRMVGILLLLLAIRIYLNIDETTYSALLLLTVVGLFLTSFGIPGFSEAPAKIGKWILIGCVAFLFWYGAFGQYNRNPSDVLGRKSLNFLALVNTNWLNPQAPEIYRIKSDASDDHLAIAQDMAKNHNPYAVVHADDPGKEFANQHHADAIKGYKLQLGVDMSLADLKGIRLAEHPDTVVQANLAEPQMVYCLNVGTNNYEPCEFFPGDVIEGFGTITNSKVRLISNGHLATIHPDGISDRTNVTLPRITELPRFALLGEMTDAEGNQLGSPFVIGTGYTMQAHGFLAAMVNGDYYYCYGGCNAKGIKPWPHPEWFNDNHGTFGLRIRRNSTH